MAAVIASTASGSTGEGWFMSYQKGPYYGSGQGLFGFSSFCLGSAMLWMNEDKGNDNFAPHFLFDACKDSTIGVTLVLGGIAYLISGFTSGSGYNEIKAIQKGVLVLGTLLVMGAVGLSFEHAFGEGPSNVNGLEKQGLFGFVWGLVAIMAAVAAAPDVKMPPQPQHVGNTNHNKP